MKLLEVKLGIPKLDTSRTGIVTLRVLKLIMASHVTALISVHTAIHQCLL